MNKKITNRTIEWKFPIGDKNWEFNLSFDNAQTINKDKIINIIIDSIYDCFQDEMSKLLENIESEINDYNKLIITKDTINKYTALYKSTIDKYINMDLEEFDKMFNSDWTKPDGPFKNKLNGYLKHDNKFEDNIFICLDDEDSSKCAVFLNTNFI